MTGDVLDRREHRGADLLVRRARGDVRPPGETVAQVRVQDALEVGGDLVGRADEQVRELVLLEQLESEVAGALHVAVGGGRGLVRHLVAHVLELFEAFCGFQEAPRPLIIGPRE